MVRGASRVRERLQHMWSCVWRHLHRRRVGVLIAGRRSLSLAFKRSVTTSWGLTFPCGFLQLHLCSGSAWLPVPVAYVLTAIVTAPRATTCISGTRGLLILTSVVRSILHRLMGLWFPRNGTGSQGATFNGDAIVRKISTCECLSKRLLIINRLKN